jgi:hypothetical protein
MMNREFLVVIGLLLAGSPAAARDLLVWEDFETGDARFFSSSVPAVPSTVCDPPAALVEPVAPTVLGDGTPGSVAAADIQTALDAGGHIVFDLGPSPQTIVLDQQLVITREVLLDGGGLVTLSGGDSVRVLWVQRPWNPADAYTARLQRLKIVSGRTPVGATSLPDNSGAGVLGAGDGAWQAVSLVVVGCTFEDNTAVDVHQDGGGGAIYVLGGDSLVIVDSVFDSNAGSNGGAVYSLGAREVLISGSLFNNNTATGFGANPGNGGNAGALGVDGAERTVDVCGTVFSNNTCNAHGCGYFSVAYDEVSRNDFESCAFIGNRNPTDDHHTGAMYLQGSPFALTGCTFDGNEADGIGGLFIGPDATGELVNCTFAGNVARTGLGGAMAISTDEPVAITHGTVTDNHAPGEFAFAGGIAVFGGSADLTITNTLIADNTGGNVWNPWNINFTATDGGGNLQWPPTRPNGQAETPATPGVTWADPELEAIADNGGPVSTAAPDDTSPAYGAAVGTAIAVDARGRKRVAPTDSGAFAAP